MGARRAQARFFGRGDSAFCKILDLSNTLKAKIRAERVAPGKYYPPTEALIAEMRRARGGG